MRLLNRKKKDEEKEEQTPLAQDEVGAALENSDIVIDNGDPTSGEADEERALLNQYMGGLKREAMVDTEDSEEEEAGNAPFEVSGSDEDDDDDVSNSLMDIFAEEQEEDADLSVLTQGLEDIDIHSLLAEARNVASRLRALVGK